MRRLTHGTERCGRGALRATALLTLLSALYVVPATASAADFNPAPGAYTADTTALTITGPGPTNITGANVGGVAVFSFDNVNIAAGVSISSQGSRPFKLVASGSLTVGGSILAGGSSATDFTEGPIAGGPGGAAGADAFPNAGAGTGGGGAAPSRDDGGGGGGFGGTGARGGLSGGGGAAGAGGAAYGNLNATLQGGSGGAGGTDGGNAVGGGGGGGAVALFGSSVTIAAGGSVRADGGSGASGGCGASGGGSGGGVVIHGDTVQVNGLLTARGGEGGAGGGCGDGGGGGGGRIAYQFRTLLASGSTSISGGQSGTRSTDGCCTHGGLSPDVSGDAGVVTLRQAASSTTGPATAVSSSGATLNGTINPHSNPTTFHFDFGTTTSYGSKIPASDAPVGSDSADHVVAQAVGGLTPNTTYHYRLVAIDALGFTTNGADVGFTTPTAPPPPTGGAPGGGGGSLTTLASTTSISSLAFRKYTKLLTLSVKNLVAGSTVRVTCKTKRKKKQKKGCPYKSKRFTTSGARARLNLRKPFTKKRMPVGTKITITITAPGYLGKQVQYTTRAAKIPKSRVRCLSATGKTGSCA
jgi:hypothetical protein